MVAKIFTNAENQNEVQSRRKAHKSAVLYLRNQKSNQNFCGLRIELVWNNKTSREQRNSLRTEAKIIRLATITQ